MTGTASLTEHQRKRRSRQHWYRRKSSYILAMEVEHSISGPERSRSSTSVQSQFSWVVAVELLLRLVNSSHMGLPPPTCTPAALLWLQHYGTLRIRILIDLLIAHSSTGVCWNKGPSGKEREG